MEHKLHQIVMSVIYYGRRCAKAESREYGTNED